MYEIKAQYKIFVKLNHPDAEKSVSRFTRAQYLVYSILQKRISKEILI